VTGDLDPEPMSFGWDFEEAGNSNAATIAQAIEQILLNRGVTPAANFHVGWNIPSLTVDLAKVAGVVQHVEPIGAVGGVAGNTCPSNVALLIRKTAGTIGKKNRGRMYLPPFSLASGNVDRLGTVAIGAMQILGPRWTNVYNDLVAASIPPVILHADGSTPTPVTGFVVQGKVATQRRRLRP
jgi:hypothetical protein